MKKVVRTKGTTPSAQGRTPSIQAQPAGTVNTVTQGTLESRSLSASPTPVWSRYVDSRLKQFCLR